MLSTVLDSVWRRHLAVAVGRRNARGEDPDAHEIAIGFADLEGFTALSQQLPEDELARVVDRFETIAYDVVSSHAGRVVKMIGDEVMFSADDVVAGADIALLLAESYAADEALADVRVGLAAGQALELEGDLYGPAVNLASRIVSLAYPGTVVVSQEVVDAVGDDPRFVVRSLRPHHLKHIGRVKLFALRRATGESSSKTLARARDRRDARRAWITERMADRAP
jgi:adenylate cyclase